MLVTLMLLAVVRTDAKPPSTQSTDVLTIASAKAKRLASVVVPNVPLANKTRISVTRNNMLKDRLRELIEEYAQEEGTDSHGAVRDILTDLQHLSFDLGVNFDDAVAGANEVYEEE